MLRTPILIFLSFITWSCSHLGFGPSPMESQSDLLAFDTIQKRFREAPLQSLPPRSTAIRVTYLPTFDSPFLIRIDRRADGTTRQTIKQLSGMGGYTPGYLCQNRIRPFSNETFDRHLHQLEAYHFWAAPASDPNPRESVDGPRITVEAYSDGHYHCITRASPGDHARERKLSDFLTEVGSAYDERRVIRLPWLR
jgi:hypothetical protein